jgi:hypothetical protein
VTQFLDEISTIASNYDAIVFDQWGVLHDGSAPYAGAVDCLEKLATCGVRMAVLSNSGKRSAPNAARIADMGFALLSYDLSSFCEKLEQLPGTAFMPGSGGGRTAPLLVIADRR